jgi:hypothetical protein
MSRAKLLITCSLLLLFLAGFTTTTNKALPLDSSNKQVADMYSDDVFLELIQKFITEDGEKVDYARWKDSPEDMAALDAHIATIAQVSPESHPDRFSTPAARKSYWINTYNALVLQAVLELWPLESVRDVKVSFTSRMVPGKGFFYDRKVIVGGQETSLYQLEKDVLASQKDPRLHFALNCASDSCPVLRPWEWTDEQLNQAAQEFVNKPGNVSVEDRSILVSRIFKWYRKDFPENLGAYLQQFAEAGLKEQLAEADTENFRVKYRDYDWTLNAPAKESSDGQ